MFLEDSYLFPVQNMILFIFKNVLLKADEKRQNKHEKTSENSSSQLLYLFIFVKFAAALINWHVPKSQSRCQKKRDISQSAGFTGSVISCSLFCVPKRSLWAKLPPQQPKQVQSL
jgi:hypothetical protein